LSVFLTINLDVFDWKNLHFVYSQNDSYSFIF
jgi:hypothetical protein